MAAVLTSSGVEEVHRLTIQCWWSGKNTTGAFLWMT